MLKKSAVDMKQRRKLSAEFKVKVALAALREDKTLAQLCAEFQGRSSQVTEWKRLLVRRAAAAFAGGAGADRQPGTGKLAPAYKIYPYMLRWLAIDRSNHVWVLDAAYIPMGARLCVSRCRWWMCQSSGLAHKTATPLDAHHAVAIIKRTFARFGRPRDCQHRSGHPVHRRGIHAWRART